MIKKLILTAFLALSLALCSCVGGAPSDSSDADVTTLSTDSTETTVSADENSESPRYFEITENNGLFEYKLYNKDGSVAEEMSDCEREPVITVNGDLIRVELSAETYYYDLETKTFSESFGKVFDENGTLIITVEEGKIVVCDIFDESGFYSEIDNFTYALYTEGDPFVSLEFADGGQTVKCVYLSGEDKDERIECFNITDKTRYTVVEDWRNKKELLSGDEKEQIKGFLRSYMGTYDYNTGFDLDYEVTGALEINGVRYYHCECYYLMKAEGSETVEMVKAAEFVLSEARSSRYDCREAEEDLIVYTENDMM